MLIGQIVRYGIVGVVVTALQAMVYWTLGHVLHWNPQAANFAGYVCAVAAGYVGHGFFTFRGYGSEGALSHKRLARFVSVSLLSYAFNALWVWLLVTALRQPLWAPIPLMALVTPSCVFMLNRTWVYR